MSEKQDLLIVQLSGSAVARARDFLNGKGFAVQVLSDLSQFLEQAKGLPQPILIVDCGSEVGRVQAYIKRLIKSEQLAGYPVVVVGAGANKAEAELNQVYPVAVALSYPCENSELFDAINYIVKAVARRRQANLSQAATHVDAKGADRPDRKRIPRLVFEQFFSLNIVEQSLGGKQYIHAIDQDRFKNPSYFPDQDAVMALAITNVCEDAGKWGRPHLHRLGYLVYQVVQALNFEEEIRSAAQKAAFLFGWGFVERAKRLLRRDYLRVGEVALRSEIGALVESSAQLVSANLHLKRVGDLLGLTGQLISRQREVDHQPLSVAASTIMASDLVDRICWQSGYWNPHAACRLLRSVRDGYWSEVHPAVICCLVKILSEAVISTSPRFLLNHKVAADPRFLQAAKQIREWRPQLHEERVALTALMPGMRLSRPLFSFDGKQVLERDLILDQDLIWRIWQLSAIRPLNAPLIVKQKREVLPEVYLTN